MARFNRFQNKRGGHRAQEWADLHAPGTRRADSKIGWTDVNHQQDTAAGMGRQVLFELIEMHLVSCHISIDGLQRCSLHNGDCHQFSEDNAENSLDARNSSDPIHECDDESFCQSRIPHPCRRIPFRIIRHSQG